jgi:HAD superfamily hydrolase (TIGR01509 family)
MIKALIFDFDGVILDTETLDYQTWQEIFQSHGVALERSLWQGFIGGSSASFDAPQHLEELTGTRVDREAIRRQRRQRYFDLLDASPVLPGVVDYITESKSLGLKLGLASSSSIDWVEGHLARRRLLGNFDSIRARDHVANVKPDPELFLASVEQLGIEPEEALVIEDSANGVTAAKAAGLYCVLVPNPMTQDLPIDNADIRLDALSDMPLSTLLKKVF